MGVSAAGLARGAGGVGTKRPSSPKLSGYTPTQPSPIEGEGQCLITVGD